MRNSMTWSRPFLVVVVVWAMLGAVAPPVGAQDVELTEEQLGALGTTMEALIEVEPNDSWSDLGFFGEDALRVLEFGSQPVDSAPYAFGDDLDTPPVITPPGTLVTDFGVVHTRVPNGWTPPAAGVNDGTAFAQNGTLAAGDDIMVVWSEFDSDVDFTEGLTYNEGITLAIEGLPVWNSTFEGDTWEGANIIPVAQIVDGQITFVVNRYEPPQSFVPIPLPAFYYRSGNVMAVGVSSAAITDLVAEGAANVDIAADDQGETRTLLWNGGSQQVTVQEGTLPDWADKTGAVSVGSHQHTSRGLFTPGFVLRFLPALPILVISFVLFTTLLLTIVPPVTAPPESDPDPDPDPPADGSAQEEQPAEGGIDQPEANPDPSGGGFPLVFVGGGLLVLIAIALIFFGPRLVGGTRTRGRTGGGTGTKTPGDDEDDGDPRDAPPPAIYGEEIEEIPSDYGVYLVQRVKDRSGERAGDAGHTLVRAPEPYAKHLGDYYVTVMQVLGSGTDTSAPPAPKEDKLSYRLAQKAWKMRSGTTRHINGDGLHLGTGLRVADEEIAELDYDETTMKERVNYDAFKTEGTCVVRDKTIVRIDFKPADPTSVVEHRYQAEAQSSARLEFDPWCHMHVRGKGGFAFDKHIYNLTEVSKKVIRSVCGSKHTANFDGPIGVSCPDANLDYDVVKRKSFWSVAGKSGQVLEFGGPELEVAAGPLKVGKVGMSLTEDEMHAKKVNIALEGRDDGERSGKLFQAEIKTDLSAQAALETNAGAMQRVSNRVSMLGDVNHELRVRAEGSVDGHKIEMTLALGHPRDGRRWTPDPHSKLHAALNSPAVPEKSDGYIEARGQRADLEHAAWYFPARAGSATPKLEDPVLWTKK